MIGKDYSSVYVENSHGRGKLKPGWLFLKLFPVWAGLLQQGSKWVDLNTEPSFADSLVTKRKL